MTTSRVSVKFGLHRMMVSLTLLNLLGEGDNVEASPQDTMLRLSEFRRGPGRW